MLKAFKYCVIRTGGKPQPLIGALVAAAFAPGVNVAVQVDDSSMFSLKDRVEVVEANGTKREMANIVAIPDGTHVTLDVVSQAHAGGVAGTGAWIAYDGPVSSVYVQTKDGNAGPIYLGTGPTMVIATGVNIVAKLQQVAAGVQPTDFSDGRVGLGNIDSAAGWWVDGTTNDNYLPTFGRL